MEIDEIIKFIETEMCHANSCPAYHTLELINCNCYVMDSINALEVIDRRSSMTKEALEKIARLNGEKDADIKWLIQTALEY